ncbi:MAG: beta-hydroxyacyl-ACP dehydratase [Arachidicoccus sp.]|nr:beta-hydroxyacyl-ACP dehydratase [Arachidicoccus sp.]
MSNYNDILEHLPYKSSFRFVDNILQLDEDGVTGEYTLREDAFFYEDHFIDNPITPGVIITEIMAQIGLVVLGIYLLKKKNHHSVQAPETFPLFSSTEIAFYKIVLPGEKVTVVSKKEYFRFGKLKCYVEMWNEKNELVAEGTFAGIVNDASDLKSNQW